MSHQPKDPPRGEYADGQDTWIATIGAIVIGVACVLGLVKLGTCLGGCVPNHGEVMAANVVAVAANETLPVLVEAWSQEALGCIDATTTRLAADTCIASVDRAWLPVWSSYDAFKSAHDLYRTEIAAGKLPHLADLQPTYCALRKTVAAKYKLPDFVPSCATPVDAGTDAAKDAQ